MAYTPAMESIFANAQQNAASLIETATLAINAKVNTIEEAEKMIQDLSSEAVMFNELLTTIMNAMRQVESGDMQKEEAAGIIAPAVKELKDKCTALKIANADAPGDDITEDEIAILRELIIGAKAAAEDRLVAIRMNDDERTDPDVEAELEDADEAYECELSDDEVATEAGILAAQYVNTNDTKTAKALYSNAKKLYSLGEKEKALGYMKKAKSLYEKALNAVMKSGKFDKVEKVSGVKKNTTYRSTLTATDSLSFSIARASLEHKIDRCTAHILQWTTKAGKETYQQTLDQLKAEREQAKAAKKAAKANENYESEDFNMILSDNYDVLLDKAVMEAMDFEDAMEGTNWDQHKMKKSYSKECRSLAKQAKKAYKQGRYAEAKGLYNKCVDLCNQFISDVKAIPQDAKDIQWGSWMYSLRTMFVASDASTDIIDNNIEMLNKQGRGELTHGDFNQYTTSLCNEAKRLAARFKKLADKAAKGELNQVSATEALEETFNYDEFMFACESYMDEMMTAMEADEAEAGDEAEGGKAPSKLAAKVRSAAAKLKSAFKRGDKKAVEEAKEEVDSATKELADAEAAAPEDKKEAYKKAAKTAAVAVGSVAAVVGLTAAGTAIYQKAKGKEVDPMALYKMAGSVTKGAVQKVGTAAGNTKVAQGVKNAKAERAQYKEGLAAVRATVDDGSGSRENKKQMNEMGNVYKQQIRANKKAAKAAAKAAKEAFGVSEFDAYEVIYEALCAEYDDYAFEAYDSDEDLANAIEAML